MTRSRKNSKNSMKVMMMVKYDDVVEEELEELNEGHGGGHPTTWLRR